MDTFYNELIQRAIAGTKRMYGEDVWKANMSRRLYGSDIGSEFDFRSVEELEKALISASWEEAPLEQRKLISHGSIALVTNDIFGWYGLAPLSDMNEEETVYLECINKESGKLNAVCDKWHHREKVDFTTAVIEMDKTDSYGTGIILSTACPGALGKKPNDIGLFEADYKGAREITAKTALELGFDYALLRRKEN